MGSSFRQDLKGGRMPEIATKLESAVMLLTEAMDELWECLREECQYDNAADTGGLIEKLSIAKHFILDELPVK